MVQVAQIRGRGGGGHLDKIQKNSYFFREAFPNCDEHKDNFEEKWCLSQTPWFLNREFGFNFEINKQSFG